MRDFIDWQGIVLDGGVVWMEGGVLVVHWDGADAVSRRQKEAQFLPEHAVSPPDYDGGFQR